MPETIVSKFSSTFFAKAVGFVVFVLLCVIGYLVFLVKYWPLYNWGPLSFVTLYLLLLVYLLFRLSVYSLVRINVAPEGLSWENLITKKLEIIPYENIVHITNYRSMDNRDSSRGFPSPGYLRLQIELCSGKQLSFTDLQFENYYELKNAIWECRQLHPDSEPTAEK